MILNRIQPTVDKLLRNNQNRFRPGRGTIAHILAIRRLVEGIKTTNIQSIITFVDFKKAFDSIDRAVLNSQDLWNSRNTNKSYTISSQ